MIKTLSISSTLTRKKDNAEDRLFLFELEHTDNELWYQDQQGNLSVSANLQQLETGLNTSLRVTDAPALSARRTSYGTTNLFAERMQLSVFAVYRRIAQNPPYAGGDGICGQFLSGANSTFILWFQRTNGIPSFSIGTAGTLATLTMPFTDNANQWHSIAGVWDGSIMWMYYDGVLQPGILAKAGPTNTPTTAQFYVGSYQGSNDFFCGNLLHVSVYNSVLTERRVRELHNYYFTKVIN